MKKQKFLSLLLTIALIVGLLPMRTVFAAEYDNTYDINSESVSISAPGNFYISGTGSSTINGITVAGGISGNVNITLDNVAISKSSE